MDNIGIFVNFAFPFSLQFLLYLHHMMLINVKLSISGYERIIYFEIADSLDQFISKETAKTKYTLCHSCVVDNL